LTSTLPKCESFHLSSIGTHGSHFLTISHRITRWQLCIPGMFSPYPSAAGNISRRYMSLMLDKTRVNVSLIYPCKCHSDSKCISHRLCNTLHLTHPYIRPSYNIGMFLRRCTTLARGESHLQYHANVDDGFEYEIPVLQFTEVLVMIFFCNLLLLSHSSIVLFVILF